MMLMINDRQYAAFEVVADRQFREHATLHVLSREAPRMPADQARQFADASITLGRRYQVVAADDLLKFIDLLLRLGLDFEARDDCAPVTAVLAGDGPVWQRLNHARMLIEQGGIPVREAALA